MYAKFSSLISMALAGLVAAVWLTGCAAAPHGESHASSPPAESASEVRLQQPSHATDYDDMVMVEEAAPAAAPRARGAAPKPTMAERHAVADSRPATQDAGGRAGDAAPPEVDEKPSRGQLLIYSGALVLAIYEVEQTQDQAVELVEEMGGYVSTRTSKSLVARVPAEKFRDAMEELGELGDVLDRSWQAQDVTEEVRDLDIRLRNALELRNRLEALLEEVETIEEALQIEAELERITLEVERIRGQLQSFEDRIAYSTIEISFRAKRTDEVPTDDFLLPYQWLNTLGLQSILRAPGVYR